MIEISKKSLVIISVITGVVFLLLGISFGLIYTNKDAIFKSYNEDEKFNSKNNVSNEETNSKEEKNEVKVDEVNDYKEEVKDNKVVSNPVSDVKEDTKASEPVTYSNKDTLVVNELNDTLDSISKSRSDTNFSDKAKSTFISLVDFVFYGGTIKGVTFEELTDAGKEKALELISKIDEKLEEYAPGYKDKIATGASKAFNKASELIKKGATNINNFAKDKLGDENYNSIIDAKDELVTYSKSALNFVGSAGSKLFTSTKDKLNTWYQNFKNSN